MVKGTTLHRLQFGVLIIAILLGLIFMFREYIGMSPLDFFATNYNVIHIGEIPTRVEIANTPETRTKGLSGRPDLGDVSGLLIVFDEPGYHGIWMKDMRFSIDLIWISEDQRVVDITRGLTPDSFPRVFEPEAPAKYVLEVDTLFIDTYGISVGNEVRLPAAAK